MKFKKANLLPEETLKIVIGVLCLILLIFLALAIYNSVSSREDFVAAQSTMERISIEFDELEINASYIGKVYSLVPSGWRLFSFVQNEVKPNQCAGYDCLCLCDSVRENYILFSIEDRQEKECSDNGICVRTDKLENFDEIELKRAEDPTNIEILKREGIIMVREI